MADENQQPNASGSEITYNRKGNIRGLYSAEHHNSNLVCAIGIRHTLKRPVSITALPLNPSYKPSERFPFFDLKIRPVSAGAFDEAEPTQWESGASRDEILEAFNVGLDYYMSGEIFIDWFEKLGLAKGKKITPMCYKWADVRHFIVDWLGPANFKHIFTMNYIDVHGATQFVNDQLVLNGQVPQFARADMGLLSLVNKLGSEQSSLMSSLDRARITAETYANLIPYACYGQISKGSDSSPSDTGELAPDQRGA